MLSPDNEIQELARSLVPLHPKITAIGETIKAVNGWGRVGLDYDPLALLRAQAFDGVAELYDWLARMPDAYKCKSAEEFVLGYSPAVASQIPSELDDWNDCLTRALKLAGGPKTNRYEMTSQEAEIFAKEFAAIFHKAGKIVLQRRRAWDRIKAIREKG